MKNSFIPLYVTNFFGTLNDNFLKTLASFIVIGWLPDERVKSLAMGVTAGALVLPYIVCSPLADRLTAVLAKRRIVRFAKWAELPIMAVAIAGFLFQSPWLVIGAVLLMGLQSSLYSPAKYALVRDIGGEARISTGMGGMEGVSFLGVLAGTVAGAVVSDLEIGHQDLHLPYICLVAFAALGLAASYTVRAEEELNRALHAINPVRYIRRAYRMAGRYDGLNAVIFTLSVFWWGAAMLQMGLLVYGKSEAGLNLSATHTGALLCAAAVGIVAGQIIAGFVDRRCFLLGATLLTGWIAAALLAVLYFLPLTPIGFGIVLGFLAFDLGFFKLPFDAEIQKVVKGPKLNTMLAYFNQVSFLFMLAASGCYALVSWAFGPKAFLLLLSLVFAVVPFVFVFQYRSVLLFTGRWIFRRRYRVEIDGLEEVMGRETLDERRGAQVESNNQTTKQFPRLAQPPGDGRPHARLDCILEDAAQAAIGRVVLQGRRRGAVRSEDAWRSRGPRPAQAPNGERRDDCARTGRHRQEDPGRRRQRHLLSFRPHPDRAGPRRHRHAAARVQHLRRSACERSRHWRQDARAVGLCLEPRRAKFVARIRADARQERVSVVLLVTVRAAPPRDDARRGSDGPREGMVARHAARVQRETQRLVQRGVGRGGFARRLGP